MTTNGDVDLDDNWCASCFGPADLCTAHALVTRRLEQLETASR